MRRSTRLSWWSPFDRFGAAHFGLAVGYRLVWCPGGTWGRERRLWWRHTRRGELQFNYEHAERVARSMVALANYNNVNSWDKQANRRTPK